MLWSHVSVNGSSEESSNTVRGAEVIKRSKLNNEWVMFFFKRSSWQEDFPSHFASSYLWCTILSDFIYLFFMYSLMDFCLNFLIWLSIWWLMEIEEKKLNMLADELFIACEGIG